MKPQTTTSKKRDNNSTGNVGNILQIITKRLQSKIDEMLKYSPTIGVFGKTGAGKSTICNRLFGEDICEISDIEACTREPQKVILETGTNKKIPLLDVPGVGESNDRDNEYEQLYSSLLPKLDVILWVLKADDRAFSTDRDFYFNVVKPHLEQGKQIIFVLNQVDKIEPYREWDDSESQPGAKQRVSITKKQQYVSSVFSIPAHEIVPISASENYNLQTLVETMIDKVPDEKKISVVQHIQREHVSERVLQETKKSLGTILKDVAVGAAIGGELLGPVGAIIGGLVAGVGSFLGWW